MSDLNQKLNVINEIETLHLFQKLDDMLISMLKQLSPEEWMAQTVAKKWKVKDVAAHLLDGNLRNLSMGRDKYFWNENVDIKNFEDVVDYINILNMSWTKAAQRLSPKILVQLLQNSGKEYIDYLHSLKPKEDAIFPVAWAGHTKSPNWFHIAREYTEKYLHQLQIRDAIGDNALLSKELFVPFMDILMFALPHTFRMIDAELNTTVSLIVTFDIGEQWNAIKLKEDWVLNKSTDVKSDAIVKISPDLSWKLFTKSLRPEEIIEKIEISGDKDLAHQCLQMVAVMA